ncbi:hypothetical protein I4641_18595 [Waterburya agarophytonicola K14]|uniref:Uncharacterized protein n=1 Tax=Waterburya agarophytonicola KI4 TaxID=2874699 RepID=A0A964BWB1_9CYAN|nr:hypothetical protein [Waterburya agarophytonicola]MCC0178981.1 hypothetical protein [Waterburya agarophytonicola KI4]
MTEANNNANSFNPEFSPESFETINGDREETSKEITAAAEMSSIENNNLRADNPLEPTQASLNNITEVDHDQSLNQKMNWQKVAHKLREYNRKLLKKVFRLEQELAEIDNRFNKYIEKSRNSDVLVAQQEQEIQKYQEQVDIFDQQLATHQQTIKQKELTINNLTQQYELFQQQTAQLERQCTLLKENYDRQTYELTAKEQQVQELQTKLAQQQSLTLQYKAELQRDREQVAASATIPPQEQTSPSRQTYSNPRAIKPWSTSVTSESKISLPKTKSQPLAAKKFTPSKTIKTAAKIATWTVSQATELPQTNDRPPTQPQSLVKVKPKSLAAVDLPTFPRQI